MRVLPCIVVSIGEAGVGFGRAFCQRLQKQTGYERFVQDVEIVLDPGRTDVEVRRDDGHTVIVMPVSARPGNTLHLGEQQGRIYSELYRLHVRAFDNFSTDEHAPEEEQVELVHPLEHVVIASCAEPMAVQVALETIRLLCEQMHLAGKGPYQVDGLFLLPPDVAPPQDQAAAYAGLCHVEKCLDNLVQRKDGHWGQAFLTQFLEKEQEHFVSVGKNPGVIVLPNPLLEAAARLLTDPDVHQPCSDAGEAAKSVRPKEMSAHYSSMGFRCLSHSSERTARTLAAWLVVDLIRKVLLAPMPIGDASLRTLEDWNATLQEDLSRVAGTACSEVSNAQPPPELEQLCERLSEAVSVDSSKEKQHSPNIWDQICQVLQSSHEITNGETAVALNQLGEDVKRLVDSALDNPPNSYGWVLLILDYLLGKKPEMASLAQFLDLVDLDPAHAPGVAVAVALYAQTYPRVKAWLDQIFEGLKNTEGVSRPKDDLWLNPGALHASLGQLEENADEIAKKAKQNDLKRRCYPVKLQLGRALVGGVCQWPPAKSEELDGAVNTFVEQLAQTRDEFGRESARLKERLTAIDEERKENQKLLKRVLHFLATSKTLSELDEEEIAISHKLQSIAALQEKLCTEHLVPALQTAHVCRFVLAAVREATEPVRKLHDMVKQAVKALDAAAKEEEQKAGSRDSQAGLCPELMDESTLRALYKKGCPTLQEVFKRWQAFPPRQPGQRDEYKGIRKLSDFLGPNIFIGLSKLKAYARYCYRDIENAPIADMLMRLGEDVRQHKLLALFDAAKPRPPFNLEIALRPYEVTQLSFPAIHRGDQSPVAKDLGDLKNVSKILKELDRRRIVLYRYQLGAPAFLLPQLRAMRRAYRDLKRNGAAPVDAPPGAELLPEYLLYDDFFGAVIEFLPDLEGTCLEKAHGVAGTRHKGKQRPNGTPLLEHDEQIALSVAEQLRDREKEWWRGCPLTPEQVVAAPLIHQVVATTDLPQDIVAREFEAPLAEAVKALSQVSSGDTGAYLPRLAQDHHRSLLLVALCERLQDLFSLDPEDAEMVERSVRETREHYLPLAHAHEPELAKRLEDAADAFTALTKEAPEESA